MSSTVQTAGKPHLNIGTIGPAGHGKTVLTAALAEVARARAGGASGPPGPPRPEPRPGPGDEVLRIEYETGTRHYAHADLPGRPGRISRMVAGAASLDGAVLVVSALDGAAPRTAEHVLLARQAGVDHLVVALSRADTAGESPGTVEREVRALLTAHGYGGDTLPVVRVAAARALAGEPRWTAAVEALLDAVDIYVPLPVRDTGAPFLMPVEQAFPGTGRGTVVTGAVERGTVRPGDRVELLGAGPGPGRAAETVVTGVETFGRSLDSAAAGDSVALLLGGRAPLPVRRGQVVAAPGSAVPARRFSARVQVVTGYPGGRTTRSAGGRRPRFHFRTADIAGAFDLVGREAVALPGETVTMTVELGRGTVLEPGLGFAVREAGRTIGAGTVTALL
jgi:elongation factor Tu